MNNPFYTFYDMNNFIRENGLTKENNLYFEELDEKKHGYSYILYWNK